MYKPLYLDSCHDNQRVPRLSSGTSAVLGDPLRLKSGALSLMQTGGRDLGPAHCLFGN